MRMGKRGERGRASKGGYTSKGWCGNPFPHPRGTGILSRESLFVSLLLGLLTVAAGCSGSGTVKVVPVMRADFSDVEPLVQNVPITEAYWAVDDRGQVVVALKYHAASLLGREFDLDWQMSLILDGMPAGSSRLYNLRSESVRIVQTCGADQRRSRGWAGVTVLHAAQNGRVLRGRFHANIRQQQYGILTGWSPPYYQAPTLVIVGEFEAIRNTKLASAIKEETESDGFDRKPVPAIHPIRMPSMPISPNGPSPARPPVATSPAR